MVPKHATSPNVSPVLHSMLGRHDIYLLAQFYCSLSIPALLSSASYHFIYRVLIIPSTTKLLGQLSTPHLESRLSHHMAQIVNQHNGGVKTN